MRAEAALWSLAVFVPANACVRAQGREHGTNWLMDRLGESLRD